MVDKRFTVTASSNAEDADQALTDSGSSWEADGDDISDGRTTYTLELLSPGQLMDFDALVFGIKSVKFKVKIMGRPGFHILTSSLFNDQVSVWKVIFILLKIAWLDWIGSSSYLWQKVNLFQRKLMKLCCEHYFLQISNSITYI